MPRPFGNGNDAVEIAVQSNRVVLREVNGYSTTQLSGEVILRLAERSDVKDVSLTFSGRAKTAFSEQNPPHKAHYMDDIIHRQELTFFPTYDDSHSHVQTLKAGLYVFPFTFTLPYDLPASVRTTTAAGLIEYRLKANVLRPGFTSHNWTAKRPILVIRGLSADAVEFSTSLDIENDWPGKVSYAFTIPHKAHAVGTSIPCQVKFVPHTKGVSVISLQTIIRENVVLHSKYHSAAASRDILSVRHHFTEGGAVRSQNPSTTASVTDLTSLQGHSGQASPAPSPDATDAVSETGPSELARRLSAIRMQRNLSANSIHVHPSGNPESPDPVPRRAAEEDGGWGDEEIKTINQVLDIQIPAGACASQSKLPVVVSHRIKWSVLIKNSDGHTSELRCALPIVLLPASLAEEVRLASSGARNLLFGPSGVLLPTSEEEAQVDLPSYPDHVHDRVANFESGSAATSWAASVRSSPSSTPFASPSTSRPGSPISSVGSSSILNRVGMTSDSPRPVEGTPSEDPSGDHQQRSNSRRSTRCSSENSDHTSASSSTGSFFSMHLPRPLRSFTSMASNSSNRNAQPANRTGQMTPPVRTPATAASRSNVSDLRDETPRIVPLPLPDRETLSRVPSYEVAERWLGGGVVPISSSRDLPSYDASNRR